MKQAECVVRASQGSLEQRSFNNALTSVDRHDTVQPSPQSSLRKNFITSNIRRICDIGYYSFM